MNRFISADERTRPFQGVQHTVIGSSCITPPLGLLGIDAHDPLFVGAPA